MHSPHIRFPTFLYRFTLSIRRNISLIPIFAVCLLFGGLPHALAYGTWIQTIVTTTIYFTGFLGLKLFCESTSDKNGKAKKKMLGGATVLLMMWFCLQFLPA